MKRRRDDAWAKADMLARGARWLNAEKDSIWQRRLERADALSHVLLARGGRAGAQSGLDPEPPTDEDVFKKTYPKFIWGKAGENTMWLFNEDRLLNGCLLYVFLTSAEVDTITLEQYGYPSVAWASDAQFPEARDIIFYLFQGKRIRMSIRVVFRSALHIYIVADNDASGLAWARKRREALGRGDIISTPSEKEVNDYCRQHTIADWLSNVPPILENRPYHA